MSRKIPLGITIGMVFAAVALTVAITVSFYTQSYNKKIRDLPQRMRQYSVLAEIDEVIGEKYYGEADKDALQAGIANGYMQGLNDRQCFYIADDDLEAYKRTVSGDISGTGITAVWDRNSGCLIVTDVDGGSPAEEQKISAGTRITSVGGAQVNGNNAQSLISELLYTEKKSLDIGVRTEDKNGNALENSVKLSCGYRAGSCTYQTVGSIGYIYLSDFYDDTAEQFKKAVDRFSGEGIGSLIIDVRNNTSSNYENVFTLIDCIVPLASDGTGAIATAVNTAGETVRLIPADPASVSMPIAVLINGKTSGAAELFACDLRDFGKAKLFGEKTAGDGKLPELITLDSGGALMMTTALIHPYISDPYDGTGVAPDETVPAGTASVPPESFEADNQFNAAYIFLTK